MLKTITRGLAAFFLISAVGFASPSEVAAQEFDCSVAVNYQNLQGNDFSFLDELQQKLREYINKRQWIDDQYQPHERIDCSMQVIMTEAISLTRFRARLVVASRRPIYGTVQQTTVVQLSDENWQFEYSRGTPLVFEPDRFDPITSVINFYAYLLLGYDYDTFSELGGTQHFKEARRIAETAESAGASGWSSLGGGQTRGELIDQILSPRFSVLREAYFDYHFGGLDHFVDDTDGARDTLLEVVEDVSALRADVARAYYLDQFFATKYQEIASAFKGSNEASLAFELLSQADPGNMSTYSNMIN